jgi:RimJ/RimL family protein N-acetyltransferase
LDEEYENQISWRSSHDKLTFIVCRPASPATTVIYAGEADVPAQMVGDVNLFLTPYDEGDDDDEEEEGEGNDLGADTGVGGAAGAEPQGVRRPLRGEVDIMIADTADRGRGLGTAAVSAFLLFLRRNLRPILAEYGDGVRASAADAVAGAAARVEGEYVLRDLVVKIQASNQGSVALFSRLGFRKRGEVNYFGEVEMVLSGFGDGEVGEQAPWKAKAPGLDGYQELKYDRTRLVA